MITKTIGSGGDYANLGAAWDAVSLPDGAVTWSDDYKFTQISDFTEPYKSFTAAPYFNGHSLTIENPDNYVITMDGFTRYNFPARGTIGAGEQVIIDNLIIQLPATVGNEWIFNVRPNWVDQNFPVTYKNILILGGGNASVIGINLYGVGLSEIRILNCRFHNIGIGINTGAYSYGTTTNKYIENCTAYQCGKGISFGNHANNGAVIKNVCCIDSGTEDFATEADASTTSLTNCADSDNSIASSGAVLSGNITGITDSDFLSADPASANFLKIDTSSALFGAGTTDISAWNTADAFGNARPGTTGVSIGIHELNLVINADFESNIAQGKPPLTVQFTDETTGGATTWLWDFGDGTTSTDQNPSHTYTTIGKFTVTLTASGDTETKTNYIVTKAIVARYGTDEHYLGNVDAPNYPFNLGVTYHNDILQNPKYVITNRDLPETNFTWQISNMKFAARDILWTLWATTFQRGNYLFTICDHKKRYLFDVLWSQWKERWKKARGGVHDVIMDMRSAFPWTPPTFAFYPFVAANASGLGCHSLDTASTLTGGTGGSLSSQCLILTEQAEAAYAARNISLSWFQQKDNSSISLLAQFRVGEIASGAEIDIINISDGSNKIRLYALYSEESSSSVSSSSSQSSSVSGSSESSSGEGTNELTIGLEWTKAGQAAESISVDAINAESNSSPAWYDICGTFDNINNQFHLYICRRGDTSVQWSYTMDFLYGTASLTAVAENCLVSDTSPTNYPEDVTWTQLYLLKGNQAEIYANNDKKAELKYAMIIDEFIPPTEFNWLRRLFHYWTKSGATFPK